MQSLILLLLELYVLVSACSAAATKSKHFITFPIFHSDTWSHFEQDLGTRGAESLALANRSDIAYYAQLNFGSPPQAQSVLLDTGSYELWINPDCLKLSSEQDKSFCKSLGHYNASASSTSNPLAGTKTLKYGIGNATFDYVADTIEFGTNVKLEDMQFGVATQSHDQAAGILGLGYGNNVATKYPNFVDQLAEQGVTKTKAFSIALGSKSEGQGAIMFGGIDTSKFSGRLQTLPIVAPNQSPDGQPRYWIIMDSISVQPSANDVPEIYPASQSMAAFVDTGSTITLLPRDLADSIALDFGGGKPDASGHYIINCDSAKRNGTLNFSFGSVTIKVPFSDMVREYGDTLGTTKCYLGIGTSDDFVLLGDSMMRSAYVVFDQTNNAIHIASYINCGTKEIEITSDLDFSSVEGLCDP